MYNFLSFKLACFSFFRAMRGLCILKMTMIVNQTCWQIDSTKLFQMSESRKETTAFCLPPSSHLRHSCLFTETFNTTMTSMKQISVLSYFCIHVYRRYYTDIQINQIVDYCSEKHNRNIKSLPSVSQICPSNCQGRTYIDKAKIFQVI